MLRYLLLLLILLHGLIHLMGFAKAYGLGNITQLKEISRPAGTLWLLVAVLFLVAALMLLLHNDGWWLPALLAAVCSQVLILGMWQEAKWGTAANIIVLVAAVLGFGSWRFERAYRQDVVASLAQVGVPSSGLITESDLAHLPQPVQRYLRYVGVVGKPKVVHYKAVFKGKMRDKGKDWFPFVSEQHNFTGVPTRLFYMKAQMFGVTVPGYHRYLDADARMDIRLFGLVQVAGTKGPEMGRAETVTLLNDMCLMAPATLIDNRLQWKAIDGQSAKAFFTVNGIKISAVLYFNEQGQLVNFVSDDRYAVADMKQYRFSTPVKDYRNFNGYNLPAYGEAIWHYPEEAFTYGIFNLQSVTYNGGAD